MKLIPYLEMLKDWPTGTILALCGGVVALALLYLALTFLDFLFGKNLALRGVVTARDHTSPRMGLVPVGAMMLPIRRGARFQLSVNVPEIGRVLTVDVSEKVFGDATNGALVLVDATRGFSGKIYPVDAKLT